MNWLLYVVGMEKLARTSRFKFILLLEIYTQTRHVVNFHAQMSSSQSEERTMFFTRTKTGTENQRPYSPVKLWFSIKLIATEFFSTPFNCWMATIITY